MQVEFLERLYKEAVSSLQRLEASAIEVESEGDSQVRLAQKQLAVKWVEIPLAPWLKLVEHTRQDAVQLAMMATTCRRFRDMLHSCENVKRGVPDCLEADLVRLSRELQHPVNELEL